MLAVLAADGSATVFPAIVCTRCPEKLTASQPTLSPGMTENLMTPLDASGASTAGAKIRMAYLPVTEVVAAGPGATSSGSWSRGICFTPTMTAGGRGGCASGVPRACPRGVVYVQAGVRLCVPGAWIDRGCGARLGGWR